MLQNLRQAPLRFVFLSAFNFFFTHKLSAQTEVHLPALKDNTLHQSTTGAFSNGMGAHFLWEETTTAKCAALFLRLTLPVTFPPAQCCKA